MATQMVDFEAMQLLITFLRANGVTAIVTPQLSLTLGEAPQTVPELDKYPEIKKAGRVGKDGLTAEEQDLLYGRVLDGE